MGNFENVLWVGRADDIQYRLPRYNVYPHVRAGSVLLLVAPPKHGKSFAALELAWAVSSGDNFLGLHPVDVQGPVLYVAGEGAEETSGRIQARHVGGGEPYPYDLALYPHPVDLKDPADLLAWLDEQDDKFVMFIFDTVNRCGGGKEDAEDMSALVQGMTKINQATGATVVLLHHSPKSDRRSARGHTSLPAAVDAQWNLDKDKGVYELISSFSRTQNDDEEVLGAFTVENVVLGINEDGREVGYGRVIPAPIPEKGGAGGAGKAAGARKGSGGCKGAAKAEKAKPRTAGRPVVPVDAERVREMRKAGRSLRQIAEELGISLGKVQRALTEAAKPVEPAEPDDDDLPDEVIEKLARSDDYDEPEPDE